MQIKSVSFGNKDKTIIGSLFIPTITKKNPAVIFIHGMTSSEKNYTPIAKRCCEKGIICLTINLRGHGGSDGNFENLTVNDLIQDGLAAYDFLVEHDNVDVNKVSICGASVGAFIGIITAAHRNICLLILRAPAAYTKGMSEMKISELMLKEGKIFHEIDSIQGTLLGNFISEYRGSLLVVKSENDEIIPAKIPNQIFESAKNAKKKEIITIGGATHNLKNENWKEEWNEKVVQWLTN